MGKVVLGMTMSLDGFINDRDGSVASLYPDLDDLRNMESLQKAIRTTGAVVMGWNAFAMAEDLDWYAGNYEFQVPIFVLTHQVPKKLPNETGKLTFTFVTDGVESAIEQAKAAARDKDVTIIGGASTAQQCLRTGLVDEMQIDIMPILLCKGLRLFEQIGEQPIQLEKIANVEAPVRTHLKFRVVK